MATSLKVYASSQRASVADFGADATGKKDATEAVRKAIASLDTTNARLVFPSGKYLFDQPSGGPAILFNGFDGIEVYANNAELHFSAASGGFAFTGCHNVALHDMKLDWSESAGVPGKGAGVTFEDCPGVLCEDISMHGAPGVGFAADNCRDLRFEGVALTAVKQGRGAISNAEHAIVIGNCHGDVKLHECRFEGMSGDGINIYQSYWRIRERLDERSVVIEGNWKPSMLAPGSFVQFSSPTTLQLMGEIAIQSVSTNGQGATLTFTETLSPAILSGMLVCSVVDGPKVAIDHCRVSNNLGRGAVLHARSEVTNSHFEGCGRAAILLAADSRRLEGPVVQNVNIRTNTFEGCNQGMGGDGRGVITIDSEQDREALETPSFTVNSGIKVQGNIFKDSVAPAIYAAGVDGIVIGSNTLGRSKSGDPRGHAAAAIVLRNVADADISGNIANVPQTVVMLQCADSVVIDGNRMLTAEKS
jgi:hypothetical protein